MSTVEIMSVLKRSALATRHEELSENTLFGVGALLDVERSSLDRGPIDVCSTMSFVTCITACCR